MSHLILHIGLHKTGTTALQNHCFACSDDLAQLGLIYPRLTSAAHPAGVAGHHGLTLNLARHFPQYLPEGGALAAWAQIVANHGASPRHVLISSEEFSRGRRGFRVDMAQLGQIARAFGQITVACVLRDQVSFLQSVYLEATKGGRHLNISALIAAACQKNDAEGVWVDWNPLYDHLLTGFAPQQVRFFDYHMLRASQAGVTGAILALAGLGAEADQVAADCNISPPPLAHWLCLPHFAPKPVPEAAIWAVQAALDQMFGPNRPTTLFTRAEVAQLRAHFAAPNAQLTERIRKTQGDFALSLPEWPETMIYRCDIVPAASEVLALAGISANNSGKHAR